MTRRLIAPIPMILTFILLFLASPLVHAADSPSSPKSATGEIIARVDGIDITEKMILDEIDRIAQELSKRLNPLLLAQKATLFFNQALERVTNFVLIQNVAKTESIIPDEEEFKKNIDEIVKRFPNKEAYLAALEKSGIDEKSLHEALRNKLIFDAVMKTNANLPPLPTDADVQKFYEENPDSFTTPEQVKASHILLRVDASASDEEKAKTKKRLEDLKADIQGGKITFADAAKQNSQDPGSGANGGDLDYFSHGQMVKPFEDAAFSTTTGQMSDIVETQFGYHLIQVTDHKQGSKVPLDEVKDKVKTYLEQQNNSKAIETYITDLRGKAKIEQLVTEEQWGEKHPSGGGLIGQPKSDQSIQIDPNELK